MPTDRTSRTIFSRFVQVNESGDLDVTGILSKDCYNAWLESRLLWPKYPEAAFRKAVVAHCQGAGGRRPFPRAVERELLKLLRQKRVWPCFKSNKRQYGRRGFNALGYWESHDLHLQRIMHEKKIFTYEETITTTKCMKDIPLPSDHANMFMANLALPTAWLLTSPSSFWRGTTLTIVRIFIDIINP